MIPPKETIENQLEEARQNHFKKGGHDGWVIHSKYAAKFAACLASKIGLDTHKAWGLALLHDIGRSQSNHTHEFASYYLLVNKGYPELARTCLIHCFLYQPEAENAQGLNAKEKELVINFIQNTEYDNYDLLVQLSDNIAIKEGYVTIEHRTIDLMLRRPQEGYEMWLHNYQKMQELKVYFDQKVGESVYKILPEFVNFL